MNQKKQTNKEIWINVATTALTAVAILIVYEKFIKPIPRKK
jgi:hypothetical protein